MVPSRNLRGRGTFGVVYLVIIGTITVKPYWRTMQYIKSGMLLLVFVVALTGCGADSLASLGQRSSQWVTEPTIVTTTTIPITVPLVSSAAGLIWFNDEIGTPTPDSETVVALVFARREGDRFIQASRSEIATALPGIQFPSRFPPLAEYVTSQLVIENTGEISDDPSAAFGIWTAEPYTRSRSVGQMIVLRVSKDVQTATEILLPEADLSCSRFSDGTSDTCDVDDIEGRTTWMLKNASGTTLIFFDDQFRYEMFGRPFAPVEALRQTVASMVPLEAGVAG